VPGVRKEDLAVRIESNELQIIGRRQEAPGKKYLLRERPQGDYLQSYTLDETVDASKVDAVLEKGVLNVTLELNEQVKPRNIPIRGE
jgi:HSP20 family protein